MKTTYGGAKYMHQDRIDAYELRLKNLVSGKAVEADRWDSIYADLNEDYQRGRLLPAEYKIIIEKYEQNIARK